MCEIVVGLAAANFSPLNAGLLPRRDRRLSTVTVAVIQHLPTRCFGQTQDITMNDADSHLRARCLRVVGHTKLVGRGRVA